MTKIAESSKPLPKWPTFLAVFLLLAGTMVGLVVLLHKAGATALEPAVLKDTARLLSIACGVAAAVIYALLHKQHRARAALLGNLTLVGGLLALGAWQLMEGESPDQASGGQLELRSHEMSR